MDERAFWLRKIQDFQQVDDASQQDSYQIFINALSGAAPITPEVVEEARRWERGLDTAGSALSRTFGDLAAFLEESMDTMGANEAIEMVFEAAYFGEGEYIISARPSRLPEWQAVPVGMTLSKSEAQAVVRWLNDRAGWGELQKLVRKLERKSGGPS